jgi:hypothetical protein
MQRATSLTLAILLAAACVFVVLETRAPGRDAPARTEQAPAEEPVEAAAPAATELDSAAPEAAEAGSTALAPTGDALELPAGAPKSVGFGVVLVTFAGVEFAPEKPRSRTEAVELARELLELAKKDFHQAVKRGDRGSTLDAGHIPRGVLEPAIEYALFTLDKGTVHDEPLETPRGFWIVRRND